MAQKYKIIESEKHEIYERGETLVFDIKIRAIPVGTLTNMTDVNVSTIDPCGVAVLSNQSMTSDSVGEYEYNYNIPDTARYGEYEIEYEATHPVTAIVTKERTSYIIFPNDIINKIRAYSGVGLSSVDNETIARIGIEALREVLDDVFEYHKDVTAQCDPNIGTLFNGTNTIVRTRHTPIADHDFDGYVLGTGQLANCSDGVDINGYWFNSSYIKYPALITVNDKISGRIIVTQADGSPIPATNTGVYFTYWEEWESYNEKILKDAVAYLAAHHLVLRMTDLHHATTADLGSNARKLELSLDRFMRKYDKLLEMISKPRCDGI